MSSLTLALLIAATAYRVWRLVALDVLTDGARFRLFPEGTKRWEFLTCPWCAGAWLTVVVWAVTWAVVTSLTVPWLVLGTATALVGLLGTVDKWHHSRPQ